MNLPAESIYVRPQNSSMHAGKDSFMLENSSAYIRTLVISCHLYLLTIWFICSTLIMLNLIMKILGNHKFIVHFLNCTLNQTFLNFVTQKWVVNLIVGSCKAYLSVTHKKSFKTVNFSTGSLSPLTSCNCIPVIKNVSKNISSLMLACPGVVRQLLE